MKQVIINRFRMEDNYSLGQCYVVLDSGQIIDVGKSLERGWKNNANSISCIPEGEYPLVLEYSPRFRKDLWEIYGVPNRRECKFHAANYWRQLNGCIALGNKHVDIDGDGDIDVTSSKATMDKFHNIMSGDTKARLIVKNL